MKTQKKLFVMYISRRQHSTTSIHSIFTHKTPKIPIKTHTTQLKILEYPRLNGTQLTEIANNVATRIRANSRWENTLISDFPKVNFSDTRFTNKLLRAEQNVVLLMRYFVWVSDNFGFKPDDRCCGVVFDRLVKAKCCNVAKWFIRRTGFEPKGKALEGYVRLLGETGQAVDAVEVFEREGGTGVCFGVKTWNLGLVGCLKAGRTDLLWKLYGLMMENEVVGGIDEETLGLVVNGYVVDGKETEGYLLLRQGLRDGLVPGNDVFNSLISALFEKGMYGRASELLHMMIARGRVPDVDTYREVIHGACKKGDMFEASRIFNDLKNRGYAPNVEMYTTMILGFCENGCDGEARKLLFEMTDKGMLPNEVTFNALISGFCKRKRVEEARRLIDEMCDKGFTASTFAYNSVINGLHLRGRIDEARKLFEEMPKKGVIRNLFTCNILIRGFCKRGKTAESIKLLEELLDQGLRPNTDSYNFIIKKLCKNGDMLEAQRLYREMQSRHLTPPVWIHEHIISGLNKKGSVKEAMQWLTQTPMTEKPQRKTFVSLINCLSQMGWLDDCLIVLGLMFKVGHLPGEKLCGILVKKLCKRKKSSSVLIHR